MIVGVIVSSGIGGLQELEDQIICMHETWDETYQTSLSLKHFQHVSNIALKLVLIAKSVTTACASANE